MTTTLNFTKDALSKLEPTEKREDYQDEKTKGLVLRVSPSGVKSFSFYRRVRGGSPVRITLGRFPEMTIDAARRLAAKHNAAFEEGVNPALAKQAAKAELTLDQFFEVYGERHGKTKKSWRDDQQRYRDYLREPLGRLRLNDIRRDMIGSILGKMSVSGKAGSTVNNVRALASSIFGKAVEYQCLAENPVRGIKTQRTNKRDRFLAANELPRFLRSLSYEPSERFKDYIMLSILTGARRSNVLEMRWSDLQLEAGVWRIPTTKNGDPQNLPLVNYAQKILAKRAGERDGHEFVFPGDGRCGHYAEPRKAWERLLDRDELLSLRDALIACGMEATRLPSEEQLGVLSGAELRAQMEALRLMGKSKGIQTEVLRLNDLRIHDLRRTFGSWQAMTGASLPIIGKSLNHKSAQTTQIYARLDLDPVRSAVGKAVEGMASASGDVWQQLLGNPTPTPQPQV